MRGLGLNIKFRCQELVFRDQKSASNVSVYSNFSLLSVDLKDMVSNRIRNVPGSNPQCCHTKVRTRTSTTDNALTNIPVVIFTSVRRAANVWKCCLGFRTVLWSFMIRTSWSINVHLFFSFFLLFLLLLLLAFSLSFATSLRPNPFFSTSSLFFFSS